MDKKIIGMVFVIASSCASGAFANSIIDKLIPNHHSAQPSNVKTHKIAKSTNHAYIDFSGTWDFNCDGGISGTSVIDNDEDYFNIDNQLFRIGHGLQGKTESNDESVSYDVVSVEWNADGTALVMKGAALYKDNLDNSPLGAGVGRFTLTMNKGQINLDGKWITFQGLKQTDSLPYHCVYTKKQ